MIKVFNLILHLDLWSWSSLLTEKEHLVKTEAQFIYVKIIEKIMILFTIAKATWVVKSGKNV